MRRYLLVPIIACSLAVLACNTLLPPHPPVEWDGTATRVVLRADTCCGMLYEPNGIPDVQVWGDGRMIWIVGDSKGGRRVLTTRLTPDQMKALLQKFVDAGFYGWKDSYRPNYTVYDAASTCIDLTLKSASKSVCDMMGNPPAAFDDLLHGLTAGLNGADYLPVRGYLQATPSGSAAGTPRPQWPAATTGLSLKAAGGGVWVEGGALEAAWGVVAAQPEQAIVAEGDRNYSLVLLIPGVTRQAPPVP